MCVCIFVCVCVCVCVCVYLCVCVCVCVCVFEYSIHTHVQMYIVFFKTLPTHNNIYLNKVATIYKLTHEHMSVQKGLALFISLVDTLLPI